MKASVNWIKQFTSVSLSTNELVEKIGAQLGAVEEVIDLGKKYEGILVVKVVECAKHPNADKLSLCLVDDGGANKKVERKDNGLIQVVCGAPNVKAGQLAAWIPPGATVPSTYDKEPFVIEARPIRNKTSHGMLASPKELALGDSHDGILVLQDGKPGDSFAKTAGLDDFVIDIENKMFTHRPDLFGMLGIAREVAGIQHQPFKSPDWYREEANLPNDGRKNVLKISVKNELPKLVPRFCAVAIKDIKVAPSPLWLQVRLSSAGVRPINNIVDITNFFMLETAQPLHAYDYDKLKTGILGVRWGKKGEELKLLGDKVIKIDHPAIVITDGDKPVGLGGIMGGADTEVDQKTKNIVLEVGNFDMNTTRRTAMAYGLFTDAATRFTKNQSPRQNMAVLTKAASAIQALAGGRPASPVQDEKHLKASHKPVEVSVGFINSRLGLDLTAADIKKLLKNVEFKVEGSAGLKITAPFWRTDIGIPEDIVEETGRLYGYDKLPVELPERSLQPAERNLEMDFKDQLRNWLAEAGANEVLTYSFIRERLLNVAGQDLKESYRIINAVSPDLQYYRLSITPSLLEKIHPNIKAGFDEFALFEIGKVHGKSEVEDKLPKEFNRLAIVLASKKPAAGAAYFGIKNYVEFVADKLNLNLRYEPLYHTAFPIEKHKLLKQMLAIYEPQHSALVFVGERLAGVVGEFRQSAKIALKLPSFCAGAEIFLSALRKPSGSIYQPLNKYPETLQDICLKVSAFPANVTYENLNNLLIQELDKMSLSHGYLYSISPLDIFQRDDDKLHRQITWRITLSHPERTLTTAEVNQLLDQIAEQAKTKYQAERI